MGNMHKIKGDKMKATITKKNIYYSDNWGQARTFEIVDDFPEGYQVWNIGRANFPAREYIPLCQCRDDFLVEISTLKALKMPTEKKALEILKRAGHETITSKNI